jgi:hypothetical protein
VIPTRRVANLLAALPIVEQVRRLRRLSPRGWRRAHFSGEVPKDLDENVEPFAGAPEITMADLLAAKLP